MSCVLALTTSSRSTSFMAASRAPSFARCVVIMMGTYSLETASFCMTAAMLMLYFQKILHIWARTPDWSAALNRK